MSDWSTVVTVALGCGAFTAFVTGLTSRSKTKADATKRHVEAASIFEGITSRAEEKAEKRNYALRQERIRLVNIIKQLRFDNRLLENEFESFRTECEKHKRFR